MMVPQPILVMLPQITLRLPALASGLEAGTIAQAKSFRRLESLWFFPLGKGKAIPVTGHGGP
jgi:hypothetical protein